MKKSTIVDVISYLLVLLFVYTGAAKLMALDVFKTQLTNQPLLSSFAGLLALAIPLVELLTAALLLNGKWRKWGLYNAFFLMSAFTLYVGYMVIFISPENLPCSCGGVIGWMTWKQHLVFNLCYTLLALTGIWAARSLETNHYKHGI
ncbi:MauE/DoxX family redox-associated membrane protein [Chitinophaga arvensicola]|uniref:Methylamine utilisation protein MauE domain-containing protein n=1 Tax=Chitinophaga arvensicola TaxID=29529 RepID=A0A1I0RP48_9BACT|nr:MauE/DoxX family redox-associated membrane protein [Chitinophaga arvensicola]SEW43047.1 hypothetical protein SAMN04488122_3171 [Chitinophaga arvensicola]